MKRLMEYFGKNLKILRKNKDWTGQKFVEEIKNRTGYEISQRSLSGYENNKREPSLEALVSIAKTLEVSVDNLLGTEANIAEKPNYSDLMKRLDRLENMMSTGK